MFLYYCMLSIIKAMWLLFFRKIFIWPTFRFSLVFSRRSVRVIQSAVIDSAIVTEEWKKRGRFGTSRVMNTIFTRSDPDLARFFNPLLLSCRLLLRFILLTKIKRLFVAKTERLVFRKSWTSSLWKNTLRTSGKLIVTEDLSNLCLSNTYCKCRRRIRHVYSL